jgi:hypothetical protein
MLTLILFRSKKNPKKNLNQVNFSMILVTRMMRSRKVFNNLYQYVTRLIKNLIKMRSRKIKKNLMITSERRRKRRRKRISSLPER